MWSEKEMCLPCVYQERLDYMASHAFPTIAPPLSPCHPGPSVLMDGNIEGSITEKQAHGTGKESTNASGGRCTYNVCIMTRADC
jgi:hypothetical protein